MNIEDMRYALAERQLESISEEELLELMVTGKGSIAEMNDNEVRMYYKDFFGE